MIFDNLLNENWLQLLVNSHVIYDTHPTLVQTWWCASETLVGLMLMNFIFGVLMACLIVYLAIFQKKINWMLNFESVSNCVYSNNGLGGQIQGLNDPTPTSAISCDFPIFGWNLIPKILKWSGVYFWYKKKWSDNFLFFCFIWIVSRVFLVTKEPFIYCCCHESSMLPFLLFLLFVIVIGGGVGASNICLLIVYY